MRQRCLYLEQENGQLYAELSQLRSVMGRLAEFDVLRRQKNELTSLVSVLEKQLVDAKSSNAKMQDDLCGLQHDFDLQRDMYLQLQSEMRQERTLSMGIFVNNF